MVKLLELPLPGFELFNESIAGSFESLCESNCGGEEFYALYKAGVWTSND